MSVVISPSCSTTSERSRRRSSAGSALSPASTSMFVRTLVSGVRSSCDASATSWRCALVDSSTAPNIVLKLAARRLSSSFPSTSIRSDRSCVSVTRSTVEVSRRTGLRAARATSRPRTAAARIPPSATRIRNKPIRWSDFSTSVSGRATWMAASGPYANVKTRRCVPSTVTSSQNAAPRSPATARTSSPTGSLTFCRGGTRTVPVRPHELYVPSRLAELGQDRQVGLTALPGDDPEPLNGDLGRARLERVVDGLAELFARDQVDGDGRRHDGQCDGGRGADGDASAEAHVSSRGGRSRRRGPCG